MQQMIQRGTACSWCRRIFRADGRTPTTKSWNSDESCKWISSIGYIQYVVSVCSRRSLPWCGCVTACDSEWPVYRENYNYKRHRKFWFNEPCYGGAVAQLEQHFIATLIVLPKHFSRCPYQITCQKTRVSSREKNCLSTESPSDAASQRWLAWSGALNLNKSVTLAFNAFGLWLREEIIQFSSSPKNSPPASRWESSRIL